MCAWCDELRTTMHGENLKLVPPVVSTSLASDLKSRCLHKSQIFIQFFIVISILILFICKYLEDLSVAIRILTNILKETVF